MKLQQSDQTGTDSGEMERHSRKEPTNEKLTTQIGIEQRLVSLIWKSSRLVSDSRPIAKQTTGKKLIQPTRPPMVRQRANAMVGIAMSIWPRSESLRLSPTFRNTATAAAVETNAPA